MSLKALRLLLVGIWVVLGGTLLAADPALGQDSRAENEDLDPALHGRRAVGLQIVPVVGPSVRVAVTPRVTIQAAGLPAMFREKGFQGIVGGRMLYKFVGRDSYNTFASVAMSAVFDRAAQREFGEETTFEFRTMPLTALTVGAEGGLGSHFSISGEVGAGRLWNDRNNGMELTFGVGLHYYW